MDTLSIYAQCTSTFYMFRFDIYIIIFTQATWHWLKKEAALFMFISILLMCVYFLHFFFHRFYLFLTVSVFDSADTLIVCVCWNETEMNGYINIYRSQNWFWTCSNNTILTIFDLPITKKKCVWPMAQLDILPPLSFNLVTSNIWFSVQ